MTRVVVWAMVAVTWLGCGTKANPQLMCSDGTCSNPEVPFCDVHGVVGGDPNMCLAVSCTPGEFAACDGDQALTCNSVGNNYTATMCPFGCSAASNGCNQCSANQVACVGNDIHRCDAAGMETVETCAAGCVDLPTPHCAYLQPRYVPDACDSPATQDSLSIGNSAMFDPNLDANCTGGIVNQTGAPAICVVRYGSISIASGVTLTARNKPDGTGRTVAFVADRLIDIQGTLDVSAHGSVSGPGGGVVMSGGSSVAANGGTGAGGAGGATAGAAGGNGNADGGGANGGSAANDPALLAALIGGAAANQFLDDASSTLTGGGGGGGGVTLVACRGSVNVAGSINAGGGGGAAGAGILFTPGWGGGAGGYVVLQGLAISVTGSVFSNGGGGGGGEQPNGAAGQPGADGSLSDVAGANGGFPQSGEGAGGKGGFGSSAPTVGRKPTNASGKAGGGGGSIGWFQTYTPQGIDPILTPAHASPSFRPNGNVSTR